MLPVELSTGQLVLKAAQPAHAEKLFKNYTGDSDASAFLQRPPHQDILQTLSFIQHWGAPSWGNPEGKCAWSLFLHEAQADPIGLVILHVHAAENTAELHFGLCKKLWGRGLATEAAHHLLQWLAQNTALEQVYTYCPAAHAASMRVLSKAGFRQMTLHKKFMRLASQADMVDCWKFTWARPS